MIDNWNKSAYCLYACEPNWIYTFCNLTGFCGLKANDANKGTNDCAKLEERFKQSFIEEFMNPDGTVQPIKSHLTGYRIPGIAAASNDFSVSCLTGPIFPEISIRAYAVSKTDYIAFDSDGKMSFKGRQGADGLDPGNYQASNGILYAIALQASSEHGDTKVRNGILDLINEEKEFNRTLYLDEGAVPIIRYDGLSLLCKLQMLRGRIAFKGAWARTVSEPRRDVIKNGPILQEASYPEILVARAMSLNGKDLDLTLYNGTAPGPQRIGFERLQPGANYAVEQTGDKFSADTKGNAKITVHLDGRTPVHIIPM